MGCNNYEIIDLGVMVQPEKIIEMSIKENVDIIGLSGLITPSLDEMVYLAKELDKITDQQVQLDNRLKAMKEAPDIGDIHYKKWDLIEKSMEISEKIEEVQEKEGFGVDGS